MTCCYSDLGGASDWSTPERNLLQPIRSTTEIWVVTRAAWNFCTRSSHFISRETSGGVSKGGLFSQGYFIVLQHKVFVSSSILLLRKKSQQSIFKMFQTVQVLDTLERQWSFKTEESYTFYIGNFSSHLNLCIKHHASWHPKNSWDVQKTTLWKFTAKDSYRDKNFCERFAPRSHFKSLMVWVNVVLNRTVVVDNDWRFDNLCGSHRQSQIKETKTKFLLIQSTLALRTHRYNGHPDNTDCS